MGRVERVLGSGTKIALLRVLASQTEEKTGMGLWEDVRDMEASASSRRPVQEALNDLVEAGVVSVRPVPHSRARLYSLNRAHPFVKKGVLPLFELDQPLGADPVGALRAALQGQEDDLGFFSAQAEDLATTPGEIVVHYLARHTTGEDTATRDRIAAAIDFIAKDLGRQVRIVGYTFQSIRERGADPDFRRKVLEQGAHLAGSNFARMAEPSGY